MIYHQDDLDMLEEAVAENVSAMQSDAEDEEELSEE